MVEKCIDAFKKVFGKKSGICCFAPGRVNLIGEHTDYNGGLVFPCAITQGVWGVAAKRDDRIIRLYSLNFEEAGIIELSLDRPQKTGAWSDYPAGVINTLLRFGYEIPGGADILYFGDLPGGAGLSSSAAIELLTLTVIKELYRLVIPECLAAIIGQFAENRFVGVNCGIMDQFAIAMGKKDHAIMLNSNSLEYRLAELPSGKADIYIVNSLVKRGLAGSAYNDRRRECEAAFAVLREKTGASTLCDVTPEQFEQYKGLLSGKTLCRARHVIYENDRVKQAAAALDRGDLSAFGAFINESHRSLKEDYEVSCKELDFLAETAAGYPGVYGSRMTGAGFGGCTVTLVEKQYSEGFAERIKKDYASVFGVIPPVYKAVPGDGARFLSTF